MAATSGVCRWARSWTARLLLIVALLDLLGQPMLLPIVHYSTDWTINKLAPQQQGPSHSSSRQSARNFWRSKPSAQHFLEKHCSSLQHQYNELIDPMMSLWNETGFSTDLLEHTSGDRVYISGDSVFLSNSTSWARTIPTFVRYIQQIAHTMQLPDMLLPLNPADEPLADLKSGESPRPLLAFCKVPGFADVLLPNTAEGGPPAKASLPLIYSKAYAPGGFKVSASAR